MNASQTPLISRDGLKLRGIVTPCHNFLALTLMEFLKCKKQRRMECGSETLSVAVFIFRMMEKNCFRFFTLIDAIYCVYESHAQKFDGLFV